MRKPARPQVLFGDSGSLTGRGWSGPRADLSFRCSWSLRMMPRSRSKDKCRTSGSGPLSGPLQPKCLASDNPVFDCPSRTAVEQLLLQSRGSLRRRVRRRRGRRGRCWLSQHLGAGARQAATLLTGDEVEVAWHPRVEAARTRPHLSARRG